MLQAGHITPHNEADLQCPGSHETVSQECTSSARFPSVLGVLLRGPKTTVPVPCLSARGLKQSSLCTSGRGEGGGQGRMPSASCQLQLLAERACLAAEGREQEPDHRPGPQHNTPHSPRWTHQPRHRGQLHLIRYRRCTLPRLIHHGKVFRRASVPVPLQSTGPRSRPQPC